MNTSYRLGILEQKHKDLHERIEALEAENAPDHVITKLKKEKLVIKDEMERLVWPNQDSGLEDMS